MSTLLLTPDYQPANYLPLSVLSWQDTVRLLVLEKIKPVHYYENWFIRSARLTLQLPSVAVTTEQIFKRTKPRFSKSLMLIRDLYRCAYCGEIFPEKNLTIDHVIPKSRGGKTTWKNAITSCKRCNCAKSSSYWRPLWEPWEPDYWGLVAQRKRLPIHIQDESWRPYLDLD